MSDVLLGVDAGSSVTKAAVFDLDGRELATASVPAELLVHRGSWVERNLTTAWAEVVAVISQVIAKADVRSEDILAVGNTSHGNGLYLLDNAGKAVRPGITSLDDRSVEIVDDWRRAGILDEAFQSTFQQVFAAQPAPLLAWLRRSEPEAYQRIGTVLMLKDYVVLRLTGELVTDLSIMAGTSLVDLRSQSYSEELLALFGIPEMFDRLPRLADSCDVVGAVTDEAASVTGLAAGTPVVAGLFDIDASAFGAGALMPNEACVIAGTWSINETISSSPLKNPNILMSKPYVVPGRWLNIDASVTSAGNLKWFVENMCGEETAAAASRGLSVYELINELVKSAMDGPPEVHFHPFLYGSTSDPSARAGFFDVSGRHTKAHLLRAIFEGVAFAHRTHIERLVSAGAFVETIRLVGGASRSRVWSQIFADVLNTEIWVPSGVEIGARGAAMCAGIGVGTYRDHAAAATTAAGTQRVHAPDPEWTERYDVSYRDHQSLAEAIGTVRSARDGDGHT